MSNKIFTSKSVKLAAIVLIGLLLVFWNPKSILDPVRGAALRIAHPFEKTFYVLSEKIRSMIGFLGSISTLRDENDKLVRENDRLSADVARLTDQKNENETLRQQLKLAPKSDYILESAFVIGRNEKEGESWMMIDKGQLEGIKSGMPVIVSNGILAGKISEVYSRSAKFALLSDSSSSVNVADLETGAKGIVRGEYGLGLLMDMVEQTDVLNVGDTIVTSGLGGLVPKGLLIGKIQQVNNTPDKLFQQAVIAGRIKYSRLDIIHVIKNSY